VSSQRAETVCLTDERLGDLDGRRADDSYGNAALVPARRRPSVADFRFCRFGRLLGALAFNGKEASASQTAVGCEPSRVSARFPGKRSSRSPSRREFVACAIAQESIWRGFATRGE
jgi:hypothetical protein